MKKKKNKPVDSTMRNVKAANRRFEEIDKWLHSISWDVSGLLTRVEILEEKLIEKGVFPKAKKRAKK